MANRRMISKSIFHDDRFTDLPPATRLLYCYLILEADDDGFITSKKSAIMFAGAKEADLQKLIDNEYIIKFASGVCVIRHWLQMNRVQDTRKTVTNYIDEMAQLQIEQDGSYNFCQQNVNKLSSQYSIGQYKGSIEQDSIGQDSSVKARKGKGSKGQVDDTDSKITSFLQDKEYKKALDFYREKIGNFRNMNEYSKLNELLSFYEIDDVIAAIDFMSTKDGKSVNYLEKVLETRSFDV